MRNCLETKFYGNRKRPFASVRWYQTRKGTNVVRVSTLTISEAYRGPNDDHAFTAYIEAVKRIEFGGIV